MADITPLVISYPDFILGQVINPEEFDQNNMEVVNKVNEAIVALNVNTNIIPDIDAKADNAVATAERAEIKAGNAVTTANMAITRADNKVDKSYVDGLAADFVLGTIPDASLTAAKLAFDVAKTARFVIGTSTAGWTSADCDYLCDGTADDVEINAAIIALPATGGEVVILDGTYNITAKINVTKDNVSIRGNGNATILRRMFDSSVTEGIITLTSRSGCKIANLQIDGNKASFTYSNNYGIYLDGSSKSTVTGNTYNNNSFGIYLYNSSDNTIISNTYNNNNSGIYLHNSSKSTVTGNTYNNNSFGIYLASSSNNTVTGNTYNSNNSGIYLYNSSDNTVTSNTCNNNNSGIHLSASNNNNTVTSNTCNNNNFGIYLYNLSNNNTVTGNTCNNNGSGIYLFSSNNTVTGNTCNNNNFGIHLPSSSNNNTITGNTCNDNDSAGINLHSSNNNTITGNTCIRGTGTIGDYTTNQYTILLSGTDNNYNLISSNNCMGKAVVIGGGTSNTEVNNKYQ